MFSHNSRQKCTGKLDCTCHKHCMCWYCLFDRRSSTLYAGTKSRIKQKVWKSGKRSGEVRVEKREIPYTLPQFKAWLKVVLEDTPHCEYCGSAISITTISPDHRVPLARGGTLELRNLGGACDVCNRCKGKLLPGEFKSLLGLLQQLPEAARSDIAGRLKAGSMGVRLRFGPKKQEIKANGVLAIPAPRQHIEEDF